MMNLFKRFQVLFKDLIKNIISQQSGKWGSVEGGRLIIVRR